MRDTAGIIRSPAHPNEYPHGVNCRYPVLLLCNYIYYLFYCFMLLCNYILGILFQMDHCWPAWICDKIVLAEF